MTFEGSNHNITELVWSPESGLSLRCANNSGSADQKPFLLWNVGPSAEDHQIPLHESMKSDGNGGDDGEKKLIRSWAVLHEDSTSGDKAAAGALVGPSRRFHAPEMDASCGDYDGKNNSMMEEEVGTTKDVNTVKENCKDNMDEDFSRPHNVKISGVADISRKDVADGISDCKRDKTINVPFPTQLTRNTDSIHNNGNAKEINTCSKEKKDSKVAEALFGSTDVCKNKPNMPLPIHAPPMRQEKGKGKALSDESAESCNNSTRLCSKGINKRQRDDDGQGLIIHGSKGMKRQTTMDSSFMKWISNMVKCPPERSDVLKEDSSFLALTKARVPKTGFQTMFQSLHCRNMDMLTNEVRNDNDSTEESKQLIENIPDRKIDESCKKIVVMSDKEVINPTINACQSSRPWIFSADIICSSHSRMESEASGNLTCNVAKDGVIPSDSLDKQVNSTEHKLPPRTVTPLKSLWLTRFSKRTSSLEKGEGCDTNRPKSNTTDVKHNKSFSQYNIVTPKDKAALSEIFHAIRNLCLSRSDILRCMNSNVSLSNLNGYFLRLRLGKMEEGIGATNYYVACITGDAIEHNHSRSKNSILVDVGGIKSSVESRYVSNHEFLEDEVTAWWCRALDSGCKVPSLEELNSKLIDRKSLGF